MLTGVWKFFDYEAETVTMRPVPKQLASALEPASGEEKASFACSLPDAGDD
jgi:hypothetical protein